MREQIFEAFGAAVKAFAAGHAVFGVRAFVAFVAGEDIQVCTVEFDAVCGDFGRIAAHVVRCELGAQVGLAAAAQRACSGIVPSASRIALLASKVCAVK